MFSMFAFSPYREGSMTARFETLVIDCADPQKLADFWCSVLGYVVHDDQEDKVEIGPETPPGVAELRSGPVAPTVLFEWVPEHKASKNRVHLDVSSIDDSHDGELARLLDLGAKKVDVGQPTGASWVVLADPEDNEFCLLRSLAPGHFDAGTGAPTSEQPLPD